MNTVVLKKNHTAQYIILIQALLAIWGSLYFQYFGNPVTNIASGVWFPVDSGFTPCVLCWWARILMYPMAWLSLMSIIKKDQSIVDYLFPISIAWILLEVYHYLLQKTSWLDFMWSTFCTRMAPCNALQVNYFGFITIPFMCLIAFVVILLCCIVVKRHRKKFQELHHIHLS